MLHLRSLRKHCAKYVPEVLKRNLRQRLFGFGRARTSFDLQWVEDVSGLTVIVDGSMRLRVDPADREHVAYHFQDNGASIEEMRGFIDSTRSARTLFDVGAHIGLFSLVFCSMSGENRAVAFEPSADVANKAEQLARLNSLEGRIVVNRNAVGAEAGTFGGFMHESGMVQSHPGSGNLARAAMPQTTLDAACDEYHVWPDVVKIDVEGYEQEVIAGGAGLFRRRKPTLFVEFHLDILEARGLKPIDLARRIAEAGYRFFTCLGTPLSVEDVCGTMNVIHRVVAR